MKSSSALFLLLSFLLLFCGTAHAEGGCPDGYYPVGGPVSQGAPQGCMPIPGHDDRQQQPPQQGVPPSVTPGEQWADSFGAIAVDMDHGIVGVASKAVTQGDAADKAIADCRTRGGATCKIQAEFRNACGVVIAGDTSFNASSANTMDRAIKLGMDVCTKSGTTNCHVYYSGCSEARRLQ